MLKKIFISLLVFVLLIVAALAILPIVFKDKLTDIARREIDAQLTAKVSWSDMGVSAFKDFPSISLYVKNMTVVTDTPFLGDTLVNIGEVIVSINPLKLINGKQIAISGIILDKPNIYLRVARNGEANYNVMRPDTSTTPPPPGTSSSGNYKVSLKKFSIKNARIVYDDHEMGVYAELNDFSNKLSGNFSSNEFELKDKGDAEVTVREGKVTYMKKIKTDLKIAMDVDQAKGKYSFKKSEITLNDLLLEVNGDVVMMNDSNITTNLTLEAKEPDFKHLVSLIPAVYSSDFKKVKTSGGLVIKGYAKGKYTGVSYPAFGLNVKVENASFQYPDLPAGVSNIDIDIKAKNPGGSLDNTVVDIDKFNLNLAGDPFKMQLHIINPVLDPEVDGAVSGTIKLDGVKNYYPLNGDQLTGTVNMDVHAKGKLSEIEKQQYQNFDASGSVDAHDVKYVSKDLPKTLHVKEFKMSVKPELVSLDAFSAQIGKSDFEATGELDNLFNYIFSKSVLRGRLKLQSKVLDLNEFLGADTTVTASSTTPARVADKSSSTKSQPAAPSSSAANSTQVPANIDFTLDAFAERVYYGKVIVDSVAGEVVVRNETVTLNGLQCKAFDGNMVLDGDYSTLRSETPHVDMKINLDMVSVEKAVAGFENTLSMMPALKSMTGVLSTVMSIKTELDRQLSPKMKTMVADGRIDVHHLEFKGNKTTNDVAQHTKLGILKFIHAKDFFTNVKVAKGNLYVEPFNLPLGKINLTIYGSHDLSDSNSANYSMLVDAPADSVPGGKPGKRTKYKVGINGKGNGVDVRQAADENDTMLQNAVAEQQSLKDAASQAKAEGEGKIEAEKNKRQQGAEARAQKRAAHLQQQAEQKVRDQGAASN